MRLSWKEIPPGAVIEDAGNARSYRTGDWRTERPVWDKEKCNKCQLCYIFCPEGCVREDAEGFFQADYFYCKGCGICAHECPTGAISMEV